MAKERNYEARVAWVLRRRVKMGGVLTDEEQKWLDDYKANRRANRPIETPPIGIVQSSHAEETSTEENTPPPLNVGAPEDTSPDDEPTFKSQADSPASDAPDVSADDEAVKQGTALADKYCAYLKLLNADVTALGGIAIPDELIDSIIHYAAKGTFTRAARAIGDKMTDRAQDATVLISGAVMYGQRHYLRQRAPATGPGKVKEASQTAARSAQSGQLISVLPSKLPGGFEG